MLVGHAQDADGRSAGGHSGSGGHLRFGEEVIPGLTLGLEVGGASLKANHDKYTGSVGGLLVRAGWRPLQRLESFHILFATGFGGGSLSSKAEDGAAGSVAGALYSLVAQYEFKFGDRVGSGLILAPYVRWMLAPVSGDTDTRIYTFVIGMESGWHFGR